MLKKKKLIILIIIVLALIVAGFLLFPKYSNHDGEVGDCSFYEKNGEIWKKNLKDKSEEKVANGISPIIDFESKEMFYIYRDNDIPEAEIRKYNIKTGKENIIKKFEGDAPINLALCGVTWSPDGKYLLIDIGSSPVRHKMLINKEGEEILNFQAYKIVWLDKENIVFSEPQGEYSFRPYGPGEGSGISIINLKGNKKILREATLLKDYKLDQIVDQEIYYTLKEVKFLDDWKYDDKQNVFNLIMDKNGEEIKS